MNQMQLQIEIVNSIKSRIASACANGERDWNLQQGYPIPTPAEILAEAVDWHEDLPLAEILNLSRAVCCEHLSLYEIDNTSDLEMRSLWLDRKIQTEQASDLAHYFDVLYDGSEDIPPDPTVSPFYCQDGNHYKAA